MGYKRCEYVNGVCKNCGRPKGWRVHRRYRGAITKDCPGQRPVRGMPFGIRVEGPGLDSPIRSPKGDWVAVRYLWRKKVEKRFGWPGGDNLEQVLQTMLAVPKNATEDIQVEVAAGKRVWTVTYGPSVKGWY